MNITSIKRVRSVVSVFVLLSILIPLSIVTYEIIFLGKNTVVFLEGYPSALSFGILIYYSLIFILAIGWLLAQLKSIVALKSEKKRHELLHLQNQVNPHFFFNMLNNLYGTVGKDVDLAKELILKLSELMRYSIYEGGKKQVPLNDEIAYLENFIELNRIRYHKKIDVTFDVKTDNSELRILPLMFIVLVENAFKHGVETLRENAYVQVRLHTHNSIIDFEIVNNFGAMKVSDQPGLGLKNLKRRLEIAYPGRHTFKTHQTESSFKATLQIRK